ncbi:MAG: hypothetical protein PVJ21_16730 [Anaerolineales bacterium]|jgi:hypothetical protein
MSFTELPEEYWPENFQFPEYVEMASATFTEMVDNSEYHTFHYVPGVPLMYIFADAKNVEFADAYTGRLMLPPEMLVVPIFKSMAKTKGPFVVSAFYGFIRYNDSFPYMCQPRKDENYGRRFFTPIELVYDTGFGSEYMFRDLLVRKLAKTLGIRRYSSNIGVNSTGVYQYQVQRYNVPRLFVHQSQHIYYIPEASDENE